MSHRIRWSNETSRPLCFTASATRYKSVSCFDPCTNSQSNFPSSAILTSHRQNECPASPLRNPRSASTACPGVTAPGYPAELNTRQNPFSVRAHVAHRKPARFATNHLWARSWCKLAGSTNASRTFTSSSRIKPLPSPGSDRSAHLLPRRQASASVTELHSAPVSCPRDANEQPSRSVRSQRCQCSASPARPAPAEHSAPRHQCPALSASPHHNINASL